ncbi:translation initiation factor 2 [Streptomyces indicus]|uniref:Leucine rich repeat variant n=1 Tax=Streptomyces indicus TaxID=417292 RepID=A0A1G8TBB8_9ACTN|nr:translation initiation factor 2 [Streptomyces indicus]SDJ38869.1 Leucine rich repeat variant [Streptomyces indicus]
MRINVLTGLAVNPAAPADVLLRLLEPEHAEVWPALAGRRASFPEEVAAAVVAHPDVRVRKALARNAFVDPEVRGLLVDDSEWIVRACLAGRPDRHRPVRPLPDGVIERMLLTYDHDCLSELYSSGQIPYRVRQLLHRHPAASVRRLAVRGWGVLSADQLAELAADDPDPEVRSDARESIRHASEADDAAAMERALGPLPPPLNHGTTHILVNCRLSRAVVDWLAGSPDVDDAWVLAGNYSTPPDIVESLLGHPEAKVRLRLAARADLPPAAVRLLARDEDAAVRTAVSLRPELTEEERASIDYVVERDEYFGPDEHHARQAPDPARTAAYARSGHPLLRRLAASDPGLPAELVGLLAHDEDEGVRLRLAHHHPAPPAELLLDCYLAHPGPPHVRELLTEHSGFPRTGLAARFADAADPAARRLALLDPGLAPETADRLTRDTDEEVRAGAARHPRLPAGRLRELLDDSALCETAAANPALPPQVMRALPDLLALTDPLDRPASAVPERAWRTNGEAHGDT